MGVAIFIEIEQLGRQRFAAGVALALVLVDVNPQLSRHGKRSSIKVAGFASRWRFC
jgi:hypothetical protein